jgi:hypothetical protein
MRVVAVTEVSIGNLKLLKSIGCVVESDRN